MKSKDKKKKLKEMTPLELEAKLKDSKEELFNFRFQLATGNLEDFSKIKLTKKEIARVMTIRRQNELLKIKA